MSVSATIQIRGKGGLTLPIELRRKYRMNEGDIYTIIDLGEGAFLLTPGVSMVARAGDRVAQVMAEAGITTEEILNLLDEERERYYQERYVEG
jgi:bifunctional DNA-binding transcriptional regulator/antitoxin component of YhaV-PrlF toxin-antitoxin module